MTSPWIYQSSVIDPLSAVSHIGDAENNSVNGAFMQAPHMGRSIKMPAGMTNTAAFISMQLPWHHSKTVKLLPWRRSLIIKLCWMEHSMEFLNNPSDQVKNDLSTKEEKKRLTKLWRPDSAAVTIVDKCAGGCVLHKGRRRVSIYGGSPLKLVDLY